MMLGTFNGYEPRVVSRLCPSGRCRFQDVSVFGAGILSRVVPQTSVPTDGLRKAGKGPSLWRGYRPDGVTNEPCLHCRHITGHSPANSDYAQFYWITRSMGFAARTASCP